LKMLKSFPMVQMPSGKTVEIQIDQKTLSEISNEVKENPRAMAALKKGLEISKQAHAEGKLASPTPPDDYIIIYRIMNKYDESFAGALASQVIEYLRRELLSGEREDG